MQAYILRSELAKYRRRAWKAYEKRKEYIEAMFGLIHNGIVIVSMFYPFEHEADLRSCSFHDNMYEELSEDASELKLKLIGTIHSHPGYNTCSHASPTDISLSLDNPSHELLSGTMHLFKKDGKSYATPQFSCLWEPVQVKYISAKGKIRN